MKLISRESALMLLKQLLWLLAIMVASNLIICALYLFGAVMRPELGASGFADYEATARRIARESVQFTPIPFVVLTTALIFTQRRRFTYGDAAAEWREESWQWALRNLAAYFILALPVLVWFASVDVAALYSGELYVSTDVVLGGDYGRYTSEPKWMISYFAPLAALYRLTGGKAAGILATVFIYPLYSSAFYLLPKK